MKICRECGLMLPLDDFYIHSQMADGHLNKCKKCVKARVNKHRSDNIDRIREYDIKRKSLPHRIKQRKEHLKIYRIMHPDRNSAHAKVAKAIRSGKLKRLPCQICGREDSHAHHEDYSKPLDVIWLCPIHHQEMHKKKNGLQTNNV